MQILSMTDTAITVSVFICLAFFSFKIVNIPKASFWGFTYLRERAIAIFLNVPPFSFRAEMKKKRDSFLIKNRVNLTKFYKKFCFFQKVKFIHFTEALEKIFNFLSMTIIVFDVLNNELR